MTALGSTATAMEGLGGVGIVNELLLQSQTGVLVLFPQVPSGVPASFTNLRARGGFLISASMATGKRTEIDVRAALPQLHFLVASSVGPW